MQLMHAIVVIHIIVHQYNVSVLQILVVSECCLGQGIAMHHSYSPAKEITHCLYDQLVPIKFRVHHFPVQKTEKLKHFLGFSLI